MNAAEKLGELEALAKDLEVDVSYEPMAGLVQGCGGLCRVNGRYRIIIDRRLKAPERMQIIVDALRRFDVDPLAVPAGLRKLLAA